MNSKKMDFTQEMVILMDQGKIQEAITSILARLMKAPTDDHLHYLMGNAYRRLGDWQHALESYAEAIALNPLSPARKAKEMADNILSYRCKELLNP